MFENIDILVEYQRIVVIFAALITVKTLYGILNDIYNGFHTHILPWFCNEEDFLSSYGEWAIVTGCTQGIGKGYARELAKRKMNIVLISRNEEKLKDVAEELKNEFQIKAVHIVANFSNDTDKVMKFVESKILELQIDIGVLVNNVGTMYEHPMPFDELEDPQEIININTKCMTSLTHLVVPLMMKKKKGAIINVSSAAGNVIAPYLTVYGASKAYADYFTKALRYEYPALTIQLITPGPVMTRMADFVKDYLSAGIVVPSPSKYAEHAIKTLGYSSINSGYWCHSLMIYAASWIPDALNIYATKILCYYLYKESKKEK